MESKTNQKIEEVANNDLLLSLVLWVGGRIKNENENKELTNLCPRRANGSTWIGWLVDEDQQFKNMLA